ncbi:MAG: L,D-transpeptidase family protein [Pseudomonadota bacterium]
MMYNFSYFRPLERRLSLRALAVICAALACQISAVRAAQFALPPADIALIGSIETEIAAHDDTLVDIARRHGVGRDEIAAANPKLNTWLPGEGAEVVLPTRYILPDAPREGIVVNLPEMRLYRYAQEYGKAIVSTHPVSVGRVDWETPLGRARIVRKQKDPNWYPPESIRAEHAAEGDPLPKMVPAGPDNPLGQHALRLNLPGYLIHGTNKPWGVGMRVTHGCLRMYPEDIEYLYNTVAVDTPVHLVNQPMKMAEHLGVWFVEVHPSLDEAPNDVTAMLREIVVTVARTSKTGQRVNIPALRDILAAESGVPTAVPLSDPLALAQH